MEKIVSEYHEIVNIVIYNGNTSIECDSDNDNSVGKNILERNISSIGEKKKEKISGKKQNKHKQWNQQKRRNASLIKSTQPLYMI